LTQQAMLEELEAFAASLAVKVSYESLATSVGTGGLCRVRGDYRVIIDKRAQVGDRLGALAHALAQLPSLGPDLPASTAALSPPVRHLLRHYAQPRAS
jgi:hypothetical protein